MTEEMQIEYEHLVLQIQERIRTIYGCPGAAEQTINASWDQSGHGRSGMSTLYRICRWKKGDKFSFRPSSVRKMAGILGIPSMEGEGTDSPAAENGAGSDAVSEDEDADAGSRNAPADPGIRRNDVLGQKMQEDKVRQQVLEDVIDCMNQYEMQESFDVLRQVALGIRAIEKAAFGKGFQAGGSRNAYADRAPAASQGIRAAAEEIVHYGGGRYKPGGEQLRSGEAIRGNTPEESGDRQ